MNLPGKSPLFIKDLIGVLAKYFFHHITYDHGIMTSFLKTTPHGKAAVCCHNSDNAVQLGKKLLSVPISLALSEY